MDATISAEPKFRLSGFEMPIIFSFPDVRIHVYCGLTHWYFYPPRRIDIRTSECWNQRLGTITVLSILGFNHAPHQLNVLLQMM